MKQLIISDLYRILYNFPLESDPDNWDVLAGMGKALISHHGLYFKDAEEMPDHEYWVDMDVEKRFFDTVCPGTVPSITAFEHVCNKFFDFDMWELMRPIKNSLTDVLDIMPAIKAITDEYACDMCNNDTDLDKHLEIPTQQEMEKALRTIQKAA